MAQAQPPILPRTARVDLLRKSGEFPMSYEELDDTAATVYKGIPDYRLSSANEKWYKTGTDGYFCEFRRWRATRFSFKRASVRPSLPSFTEPRLSAGRQ